MEVSSFSDSEGITDSAMYVIQWRSVPFQTVGVSQTQICMLCSGGESFSDSRSITDSDMYGCGGQSYSDSGGITDSVMYVI